MLKTGAIYKELRLEMWKQIPNLPGYEASSSGQIRSKARSVSIRHGDKVPHKRIIPGKVLALNAGERNGKPNYITVRIGGRTHAVHRLVAFAFLGMPTFQNAEINHKDGSKQNNNIVNLEWVTHKQNERHSVNILGKAPWNRNRKFTNKKGVATRNRNHNAKCKKILAIQKSTGWSAKQIAKSLGLSERQVYANLAKAGASTRE